MYPCAGQENINSNISLHFFGEYNHIHWSAFCDVIVIEKQQQQPKMQSRGIDNF